MKKSMLLLAVCFLSLAANAQVLEVASMQKLPIPAYKHQKITNTKPKPVGREQFETKTPAQVKVKEMHKASLVERVAVRPASAKKVTPATLAAPKKIASSVSEVINLHFDGFSVLPKWYEETGDWYMACADAEGWIVTFDIVSPSYVGTFTTEDFDLGYSYMHTPDGGYVEYISIECTITEEKKSEYLTVLSLEATIESTDGNTYVVTCVHKFLVAKEVIENTISDATLKFDGYSEFVLAGKNGVLDLNLDVYATWPVGRFTKGEFNMENTKVLYNGVEQDLNNPELVVTTAVNEEGEAGYAAELSFLNQDTAQHVVEIFAPLAEPTDTIEIETICYGETFAWNGSVLTQSGIYTYTTDAANGCDSVTTLHLTVLPQAITIYTDTMIAYADLPYQWRGLYCNTSGEYTSTIPFAANAACDSVIYVLHLTVEAANKCGANLSWEYQSGGVLNIMGSGAMYDNPEQLTYRSESWYPSRVRQITLPNALTHIGNVAFADCANLTHIDIPSSVTSIGDGAFSWTGLQSVTIPASVTELGEQVFEACSNLHTIIYEGYPTVISNQAIHPLIGCVHLDTVIAPAALWHCTNADKALENRYGVPHKARYIEVTDGLLSNQAVKYIAQNASALEVLDLTNTTNTTLPYGALYNSYQLTQLYLPAYIETLPESMIEGGSHLSEITIPATVTEIGNYAFAGCVNIWRMTVEATTPPKVYENTFDGVKRSISVLVPAGSEQAYREAEYWREFFIDNTNSPLPISNCQKIFHEDQILILREGKVYTTMGQLINTEKE